MNVYYVNCIHQKIFIIFLKLYTHFNLYRYDFFKNIHNKKKMIDLPFLFSQLSKYTFKTSKLNVLYSYQSFDI